MSLPHLLPSVALFALLVPPPAHAQQKLVPAYTEAEAAQHAGEEAAVTGKVVAVSKSAKGTTYLNFGDRFPRQTFSGVVLARDEAKVGDLTSFEGKAVTVTGRIELSPDKKPQILISGPTQIKLAEPASASASASTSPPAPAPMPVPSPAVPAPGAPPAKPAEARKIVLAPNWNSPTQGAEMTRKDLAAIFAGQGAASESVEGDPTVVLFGDVTFLAPLAAAKKRLQLDGQTSSVIKVTCPGLPLGSFTAHGFSGIFAGGFSRLYLVTDVADQVVSVLLVDENTRQRTPDVTDTTGYHTYNFINGRVKGTSDLVVKHQIVPDAPRGVVVLESMLIDPKSADPAVKSASTSRSTTGTSRSSRTGKVMERSRWIVPVPIVNLIMRCVGNR